LIVAVTIALSLLFGVTAFGKLTSHGTSIELRDHHGVTAVRWRQIGALEVLGVAGLLIGLAAPAIGIAAAAGLAILSLGAIAVHVRDGDSAIRAIPAVVALALSVSLILLQAMSR
jgi:hypothetical protein